jgi:O-antigen ligase
MYRGLRQQRDRISLYFLFGLFVLLPLTVVFGHKGVAPWLLLASLPAFARGDFWQSAFGQLFDQPDLRNPFFFGFAAIIGFCVWIFLSGFWSPGGQPSLALYVLAPVIVGGSVVWFSLHLSRLWSYRLSYAYAISIAAGMAVLLFEGMSGGLLRSLLPPEDPSPERAKDIIALGRGVTALAPALFPAAIIVSLIWNRYVSLGLLMLGVAAAFSNDVTANAVAISVGLVAGVIAFRAPRRTIMLTGWTVIVLLLLAPLAALLPVDAIFQSAGDGLPPSWLHRIAIWQSVATKIPGGLPFGYGADFARAWQETAPLINVPGAGAPLELMPTHPHNFFLQIWLELGLPGVLSFTAFVYCGMKVLKNTNPPAAVLASVVGAIAAIAVSMSVEGSLWQVWRLAAMALAGMGAALAYSLHHNWSR